MQHTYLLEPGRWIISGHWLERNHAPIPVEGKTIVAWNQENWFTMVTKLVFPDSDRPDISFQYRGRLDGDHQYTFILQHSELGRVEGEGWIGLGSMVQRYWVLEDKQRRSGFETAYQINPDKYCLSSGIMSGHYLNSTMEAMVERQD